MNPLRHLIGGSIVALALGSCATEEVADPNVFEGDAVVEALDVAAGETIVFRNGAVVTVTGDANIAGTLDSEDGPLQLRVEGDLELSGTLRSEHSDPAERSGNAFTDEESGIYMVVDGAVTFAEGAAVETNGDFVLTDDVSELDRDPATVYDEADTDSGTLPTLVPLPDDAPPAASELLPQLTAGSTGAAQQVVWTIRGNWDFSNFPGDRPIVLWRINEDHDLVLDNLTVTAPPGRSGDDEDQSQDPGDEGKNADGDPGKPGMNLNIWNNTGSITIRNTVTLSLADGGDGGEATATCATATGGAGAKPGNFRMTAANGIDITNGALVLVPGSGGAGGDATVNKGTPGANGCPGAKGADATATGGPGGENRKRLRVRGNVTGVANISIGLLAGGGGGEAKSQACDGGDGTVCPCDGGPGGAAIATGGPGGEASLDVSGLGVTTAGVKGGDGGPADATGGNGGDGPGCKLDEGGDGGAGGDATAVGGAGGEASGAAATQGAGGDATATSGDGGDGGDSAVLPGTGGDPGTATATGGVDGAGAPSGQETATNGNPGEDGDAIPLLLFCYDFAFLGDFAVFGAVPAGTYTGNLVEAQSQTLLGTMDVDLVDDQGSQYSWQDTPIEHVGFGPGTMRFRFDSIVLEAGDPPPFMAFDIASLYGEGLSQSNPMVVQFLDGTGNVVESHDVTQLPDNTANPRSPEVLSLPIPLEGPQVVEVVMFVPPSAFVTIISVYLLDP